MRKLIAVLVVLAAAAPAQAKLGPNPSDKRLASEFLRLLQAKDAAGLRAFLSPAFLLQRADGTWLGKEAYLANPAVVESYTVSEVDGTRTKNVRVIRYTVQTRQTIDGQQVSADPVPRISTYVKRKRTWQLVAHANFNAPVVAEKVRAERPRPDEDIVFTAHSLPSGVAAAGDPYPIKLPPPQKRLLIGAASSVPHGLSKRGQNTRAMARTRDLSEHVRLRAASGVRRFPSCQSDSSAIARRFCSTSTCRPPPPHAKRASALRRTQSLNTSPTFIRALAELARQSTS